MPLFERDRYQRLPLDVSSAGGGAGAGGGGARRPASSCASATIILFVGLCLVGAWMMASTTTSNVAVSVSSENKGEDDRSADLTRSVVNGGKVDDDAPADTTQTGDAAGAGVTGKKDDGGSVQTTEAAADNDGRERQQAEGGGGEGDTPHTTENAGKEDEDGPGDTPQTGDAAAGDTDKKDDDGGAAQTTEDAVDQSSIVVVEPTDAAANGTTEDRPNGDTVVGAGELPSKNVTFSDESGMMEEGDVAKPDDTDKKAQNGTEEATTGVQTDKSAEDAATSTDQKGGNNGEQNTEEAPRDTTNTGDQVDKSSDGASSETGGQEEKKEETRGQADNITDKSSAEDTPAFAKDAGDDGTAKNQTAFDDHNGNLDGNQNGDKVTGDDTAASNNQTAVDHKDAPKNQTSAALNDTIFQEAGMVPTNSSVTTTEDEEVTEPVTGGNAEAAELLPSGQAELLNETTTAAAQNGTFPTQATESREEKKKKKEAHGSSSNKNKNSSISNSNGSVVVGETSTEESSYVWKLCNASTGADYIPCLDNEAAIRRLRSTKHYEHRERHCPSPAPSCLVPLPEGYRRPIPWPNSRDRIWYNNVPNTKLASFKGHQNWVKVSGDGEHLEFPGGGTQFLNGASHYIYVIQEALPAVAWGTRSRVVLDVGCGVASFGGYLFDKDALTMSFAPKDEHEAQVQFALERGIPAISAVMGTKRLPFPSGTFDVVHCARCRVPWHIEGGKLLLEVNRLLRPGGLFVWSATPVYRKDEENVGIWQAMVALTKSMCWEMVTRTSDTVDQTALVIFKKPSSNDCYGKRSHPEPALCEESDNPNAAWNITLQACMHRVPTNAASRGSRWPAQWPERLTTAPYWLVDSQVGVYGKPAPDDFSADTEHWRKAVNSSYLTGMGIDWSNVRNVMDMRSVYGGFAAALLLLRDMKVWVMNVVPVDSPDTLPIIYERGLFGMYHDWCESFSTYPRSYDLVHADHLFSKLKYRCKVRLVIAEVDRILRPEGKMIVREDRETAEEVERISKSLHWEVRMDVSKEGERLLCFQKTMWRPTQVEALS